jgi:hypothetical protein
VNPTDADVPRWGRYTVISAALAGIVWGATGIVLNIPGNFSDQIVVLLVTNGLAFTSTYLAAPYLPAFRAFVYPTFVLSSVPFLLGGDLWRVLIGLATLASAPVAERLPVLHRPFHAGRLRTLINNLLHAPVARARRAS